MTIKAVAVLIPDKSSVSGTITFTQESENAPTKANVEIKGLTPGEHGFHIQ
jgi:superoxide dismutase, Cu-Zn family